MIYFKSMVVLVLLIGKPIFAKETLSVEHLCLASALSKVYEQKKERMQIVFEFIKSGKSVEHGDEVTGEEFQEIFTFFMFLSAIGSTCGVEDTKNLTEAQMLGIMENAKLNWVGQ